METGEKRDFVSNRKTPNYLLIPTVHSIVGIRDILVRIRILFRIRGSVPLTDPSSDPALIVSDIEDAKYFCLLQFVFLFLLDDGRIWIRTSDYRRRPKNLRIQIQI
jgi:hypothetical protein